MPIRRTLLAGLSLLVLPPTAARADSLIAQGLPPLRVTVTGFADGKLAYQTATGTPGGREYGRVQQLVVDTEPALSQAEAERAGGQTEAALDDYAKAVRTTDTPWVRAFAARRIDDLAGPGGRFDARLAAYLGRLQDGDADALRPALPERGSRLLDVAVDDTERVLKSPKLDDAAKVALFDFLIALHDRRGDTNAVAQTVERLAKATPAAASDPAVRKQLVALKITQAKLALDKKDPAAATRLIDGVRADVVDPAQQSDALFVLASAGLAAAGPADKNAQEDAALAFMRVVALSEALPGRPNVLASLRATAAVLERTGDPAAAAKLYGQIAKEFADDPAAAAEARADARRLATTRPSGP